LNTGIGTSEGTGSTESRAFELLHEDVQRWIWSKQWSALRDIQEGAIPIILAAERDLIISAGTASGKTEAAFLPIVSRLADDGNKPGDGYGAIYCAPLKALLNDQESRMESLCEMANVPVVKWHGDAHQAKKASSIKRPGGILLITPESLEAMLMHRGRDMARLFRGLKYVVIDEMHVFLDSARGCQLLSIIHRIEKAAGASTCRIGLSATLADAETSKRFLKPLNPDRVIVLPSGTYSPEIRLQVRGYSSTPSAPRDPGITKEERENWIDPADTLIHKDLFQLLRGGRHMIFAGSRIRVETVTDALTAMSSKQGLPHEFFAHHGNLAKEFREASEAKMRDTSMPATVVCTSTLELGIDVGDVETIAQIGPGHTVSGMRQRLGRSGRRDGRAGTMRVFIKEIGLREATHPMDAMRFDTFHTVAMITLMLRRWNEPPEQGRMNLSTMLQQTLSMITQGGGTTAAKAWDILGGSGSFPTVDLETFKIFLRQLGRIGVIEQADDGTLLPGPLGEQLLGGRDLYSVFSKEDEYRVIDDEGHPIGQVPATNAMAPGQFLLLGGRRWEVTDVSPSRREILVRRSRGGRPPVFGGEKPIPADGVINEMRRIYAEAKPPAFLDEQARRFLSEGCQTYQQHKMGTSSTVTYADHIYLMPWVGGRRLNTLFLALCDAGSEPSRLGLAITIPSTKKDLTQKALAGFVTGALPSAEKLARAVEDKAVEKFDHLLGDELLTKAYASERIDTMCLPDIAADLLERWGKHTE